MGRSARRHSLDRGDVRARRRHAFAGEGTILVKAIKLIVLLWFRTFHTIRFVGAENVPTAGPVILAANHPSYMDPLVVSLGVDRLVRFFALGSMLEVPLLGAAMKAFGVLPVYPELGSEPSFQKAVRILSRGGVVGIFPEGHRSKFRLMGPVRRGVGRLAIETGAPIVPVTLDGTYEAWPTGVHTPRPHRIKVTYHEPVRPDRDEDPQALADRVADIVRSAQEAQQKQARFGSDARRGPRTGY